MSLKCIESYSHLGTSLSHSQAWSATPLKHTSSNNGNVGEERSPKMETYSVG